MIRQGIVEDVSDYNDGGRIKVRIANIDNINMDLPYAFPLLPKMLHVKPKVGEAVDVLFSDDDNMRGQRRYVGPIISQPQMMYKELYGGGALSMLRGGMNKPLETITDKEMGAFPYDDDIAICGRKNSDIILSDDDLRLRCGVHLSNGNGHKVEFNKLDPAFVKLKYHENPLKLDRSNENFHIVASDTEEVKSTATVMAQKINLLSINGDPYVNIGDTKESISDEDMTRLLTKAHQLPYGDKLVEFLVDFIGVFMKHTHRFTQLPPVDKSPEMVEFFKKYGTNTQSMGDKLLSDNVRIS